jgi:hypothetical protein
VLALGPGRNGQLGDPLLVPPLAFGCLGLQPHLGLLQPRQPAARAGQLGWEFVTATSAMLVVLGLVGLRRLPQDLLDFVFELGEGAVGSVGGVGGHLGPVQGDHAQMDQPGCGAQLQRGDQETG